ncbi:MAG: DUF2330 domain-containing protein [Myxococcales bacterium]|nr:DUF2330 domain-containing protein [Myxococcales bacterium]
MAIIGANAKPAQACGGFFCSAQAPVVQQGERIVFVAGENNVMTAIIEIVYSGPSESFSWVLPVTGVPEVGVSSTTVLDRLQQATAPSFRMTTEVVGDCREEQYQSYDASAMPEDVSAAGVADTWTGNPNVHVEDSGTVGPYDYDVISVAQESSDPAAAALDWLDHNGYDVGGIGPEVLRDYLSRGANLIAFRLTKSADAGEIRPVTLSYPAANAVIPIRLTAVAAAPDMGVAVYVFGEYRAVPDNYAHVHLNLLAINWFSFSRFNYDAVVTAAINEAGGQGFTTEFAGSANVVDNVIWTSSDEQNLASLGRQIPTQDDSGWARLDWLSNAGFMFSGYDAYEDVIGRHLPIPDFTTAASVASCVDCFLSEDEIAEVDLDAFYDDLVEDVVEPLQDAEDLFDSSDYLTRMYTTVSADEMTVDPVFVFNAEMDDYSNVHTTTRTVYCSPDVYRWEAPWVTTIDGVMLRGRGSSWPVAIDGTVAASSIEDTGPVGQPLPLVDNSNEIAEDVATSNANFPTQAEMVAGSSNASASGCQTTAGQPTSNLPFALLVALALLASRRSLGTRVQRDS